MSNVRCGDVTGSRAELFELLLLKLYRPSEDDRPHYLKRDIDMTAVFADYDKLSNIVISVVGSPPKGQIIYTCGGGAACLWLLGDKSRRLSDARAATLRTWLRAAWPEVFVMGPQPGTSRKVLSWAAEQRAERQ